MWVFCLCVWRIVNGNRIASAYVAAYLTKCCGRCIFNWLYRLIKHITSGWWVRIIVCVLCYFSFGRKCLFVFFLSCCVPVFAIDFQQRYESCSVLTDIRCLCRDAIIDYIILIWTQIASSEEWETVESQGPFLTITKCVSVLCPFPASFIVQMPTQFRTVLIYITRDTYVYMSGRCKRWGLTNVYASTEWLRRVKTAEEYNMWPKIVQGKQ